MKIFLSVTLAGLLLAFTASADPVFGVWKTQPGKPTGLDRLGSNGPPLLSTGIADEISCVLNKTPLFQKFTEFSCIFACN